MQIQSAKEWRRQEPVISLVISFLHSSKQFLPLVSSLPQIPSSPCATRWQQKQHWHETRYIIKHATARIHLAFGILHYVEVVFVKEEPLELTVISNKYFFSKNLIFWFGLKK